MALADLKELETQVWKEIERTTQALRTKVSNRKTHIISCSTTQLREECDKQMAAREGYKDISKFKKGLKDRFGNDTPFNAIMKVFTDHVGPLVANMYRDLENESKQQGSPYVIKIIDGSTPNDWIVEIYLKAKKGGRGDVFQGFKDKFKSDNQRPLVEAINDWAMTKGGGRNWGNQHGSGTTGGGSGRTYSRRGQTFTEADEGGMSAAELNRKIGSNTGRKGGKEASRTIRTKGKQGYSTEKWIDQEGKVQISDSNDPFVDLGHEDDSAVAGLRRLMLAEFLDNWKGRDGTGSARVKAHLSDRINLNIDSNSSYAGEITKKVRASFEASSFNKDTMTKKEVDNLNDEFFKAFNAAAGDIYQKAYAASNGVPQQGSAAWIEMESSDSFATMVEKKTIEEAIKPLRGKKGVKLKTRLKTQVQKNSRSKLKGKTRKPKVTPIKGTYIAPKVAKVIQATRKKKKSKSSPAHAPLFLLGVLQEQLPTMVQNNMGEPALTNRTGRFASSVRATDIAMTPQGFPSIGYTYRRDPYEVHEQDSNYDPRKLIDRTMREIAAEYAIGRFYTRRV